MTSIQVWVPGFKRTRFVVSILGGKHFFSWNIVLLLVRVRLYWPCKDALRQATSIHHPSRRWLSGAWSLPRSQSSQQSMTEVARYSATRKVTNFVFVPMFTARSMVPGMGTGFSLAPQTFGALSILRIILDCKHTPRLVFWIGFLLGCGFVGVGISYRKIRFCVYIRGIRYLRILFCPNAVIPLGHVI